MFCLRNRAVVGTAHPWWVFVAAGVGLGVVPVLLIVSMWNTDIVRAAMSPEARLFYLQFGTFGAVFGDAFYVAHGRRSA